MIKEISNALVEADVNIKLVASLRNSIKRTVNFKEQAACDNLERFLLELGTDFTFIARQKRLTIGKEDF